MVEGSQVLESQSNRRACESKTWRAPYKHWLLVYRFSVSHTDANRTRDVPDTCPIDEAPLSKHYLELGGCNNPSPLLR